MEFHSYGSSVIQMSIDQGEEGQMWKKSSGNSKRQQLEERPVSSAEQPQPLHHSEDARQVLATLYSSAHSSCTQQDLQEQGTSFSKEFE